MIVKHPMATLQEKVDRIYSTVTTLAEGPAQLLKGRSEAVIYHCSLCNGAIYDGNACIDVTRLVEQLEVADGKQVATIIDADTIATFCAECGNMFAYASFWRRNLGRSLSIENLNSSTNEETCDRCHCPLEATGARVIVEVMISQVEHAPGCHDDTRHTTITSDTALNFCPRCGNHKGRTRLQHAVDALLRQWEEDNGEV